MRVAAYEFAEGSRFQAGAQGDAKTVGQHLDLLRQQMKGELTPKDVLDDARHDNSPLHSYFEWDDGAAAEAHRLAQARGLIRSVVAVYVSEDKPAVRTKAFVHVPEPSAPHYRSADHAMTLSRTRQLVLNRAWGELSAWRKRYADLREFSELFDVVDEIEQTLLKLPSAG